MSGTLWQRLTRGICRLRQRPDWAVFAGPAWLDRIMSMAVTDRFHAKQGRSTGRVILRRGQSILSVYLKRHYHLPRWRGLVAAFWPGSGWSPALVEWRHLKWARAAGMPVPSPVAAGEYIGPWGLLQSFLAVEELHGMIPLNEAIPRAKAQMDSKAFLIWKIGLTGEVARLTRELHGQSVFHKDLYLCHFYIPVEPLAPGEQWCGRVHLIDLHRLARHHWTWPAWQVKDLAQLLYSSDVPGIGQADRLRFWRAYLGGETDRVGGRWLRRFIWIKYRRYCRHNARRG